jgi:hypothetical protein
MTRAAFRRRGPERGSGSSLTPAQARVAWRGLCEAVAAACRSPLADHALALVMPLRAAPEGSYPLPPGDLRRLWVEEFRARAVRWLAMSNPADRVRFADALATDALAVERLTFDLGAEVAQAARRSSGQGDD